MHLCPERCLGQKVVRLMTVLSFGIAFVIQTSAVNAQTFSKIVDNNTANPIGGGTFSPDTSDSIPSIDGSSVVFRNLNSSSPELYSFDGTNFKQLATTASVLPGLL